MTDDELDLAILRQLRDDEAHSLAALAEAVGEPAPRVEGRLAAMAGERRVRESPVARGRWMRIKADETREQWTDRVQAFANSRGLYLKEDGPNGQGGGDWLVRIRPDGQASTDRDDWFG